MTSFNRVLVFDVETNGLLPKKKTTTPDKDGEEEVIPHILQLSFIVYHPKEQKIAAKVNHYIKVSEDVPISKKITGLTGIDRELCKSKGVPISHALMEFYEAYMNCDCVVAHNIWFDRNMIRIEIERNRTVLENMGCSSINKVFQEEFEKRNRITTFCTMRYGRSVCKIERVGENGEKYYKNPRLVELFQKLFDSIPSNLHDSMVDTYVCLMCFAKMKLHQTLPSSFLTLQSNTLSSSR